MSLTFNVTDYLHDKWTHRNPETVNEEHLAFITKVSEPIRRKIPHIVNISYGPLPRQKLNIFGTDLPEDAPIVLFVHGGSWSDKTLGREKYEFLSDILHENGIKSIFIGYELRPELTMLEICKSLEVAVSKCFQYINETKSKSVYFWGYSAGVQLVLYTFIDHIKKFSLEDEKKIKAVIMTSGIYNLTPLTGTEINKTFGLDLDMNTAKVISPLMNRISCGRTTEFHVFLGEFECPLVIQQSKSFHKKLMNWGYKSTIQTIENVDHYTIIEEFINPEYALTKAILTIIKKS